MSTKTKKKTAVTEKSTDNFSMKNAISHANKLLAGFDNTSIQIKKMNSTMQEKMEKLEEHNRDLRATLSGITNAAENAIQDAKLAKTASVRVEKKVNQEVSQKAKKSPVIDKAVKAKATAKKVTTHTPIRDLVQQFITKNGASSAKDIFRYVSSQQPASRAAVYQTLKKNFTKKGEGTDAVYSVVGKTTTNGSSVTDDEAERFIQKQSSVPEKDLSVS